MRMRILILSDRIPPEHAGGAEKVAWNLALGLRDAGHEVSVVAATTGAPFEAERDGIMTHHLHSRYPARLQSWYMTRNPQVTKPLRRLVERLQPEVVNAHNVHNHLSYSSLAVITAMGIPVVFTAHDVMPFAYAKLTHFVRPGLPCPVPPALYRLPRFYNLRQMRLRYNPFRNLLLRRILNRCTARRVAVSGAMKAALEANDLPSFEVVPNGVDPARFQASVQAIDELRTRLHLHGRRVILFGGRLGVEKGVVPLMAALRRVVKVVPETTLLALTSVALDPALVPAELAPHVVRGGWLSGEALAAAFQAAETVVVPSICFESAGMMALESLAAGTPVVASCMGGLPEVVGDGGLIVDPFDTAAFADALIDLLHDSDLRATLSRAGRARVESAFTLRQQAARMAAIFQESAATARG